MKKLLAVVLAMLTVFSFGTVAFAANTTTLTTTVPDAEYTLNIPADQEIDFGTTDASIGAITVTESSGFAVGKDLKVVVNYTEFAADGVTTTIPFDMYLTHNPSSALDSTNESLKVTSGSSIVFEGESSTAVKEYATVGNNRGNHTRLIFKSADWGKALAGNYTATITFTAEVVAA